MLISLPSYTWTLSYVHMRAIEFSIVIVIVTIVNCVCSLHTPYLPLHTFSSLSAQIQTNAPDKIIVMTN